MRLTEKLKTEKGEVRVFTRYVKDNQQLKDEKLCNIEDIEEDIGIEVTDFFKLRKAEKVYLPRFKSYYKITAVDVKTMEIIVSNKKKIPMQHTLKIKNYGRTWTFKKGGDNE